MTVDPLLSWGPILECLLIGKPPPGVPPGDEAHDGAIRIFGVISVLSDSLLLGKALTTRRKLLSGEDGDPPNHHPPNMPPEIFESYKSESIRMGETLSTTGGWMLTHKNHGRKHIVNHTLAGKFGILSRRMDEMSGLQHFRLNFVFRNI